MKGNIVVLETLIDEAAQLNILDYKRKSALHYALEEHNWDCA